MTIRDAIQIVVAIVSAARDGSKTSPLGTDSFLKFLVIYCHWMNCRCDTPGGFSEVDLQVLFFVTGIAPGLGASHDRPSDRREENRS